MSWMAGQPKRLPDLIACWIVEEGAEYRQPRIYLAMSCLFLWQCTMKLVESLERVLLQGSL